MANLNEEAVKVSVNWWADKISGFKHHDNGANDRANFLAMAIADSMYKDPDENQIVIFKDALAKRIREEAKEWNHVWLSVDYDPCRMLRESALEAGISVMNFPFKTDMDIREDAVNVSDGYGQPWISIWNAKAHSRSEQPAL